MPAAGNGSLTFANDMFSHQDVLDLKTALADTNWDGSASSLDRYLHTREVGGNTELRVSVAESRRAPRTTVATFDNQNVSLATILAHSIT